MTPRPVRTYAVLGFRSTHDALLAESVLKDARLAPVVIPAPLALGSLCGIAVRMDPESVGAAEALLLEAGVEPTGRAVIEDV